MTDSAANSGSAALARAERRVRTFVEEIEPFLPARAGRFLANVLLADRTFRPTRLLDLGGGTGELAGELLMAWPKTSLDLVEAQAGVAELARARFAKLGLTARTTVHAVPALHLPLTTFAPSGFDGVVANLLPEDVATTPALLHEAARLLRAGGRVAATVIARGSWREFADVFRETLRDLGRADAISALEREEEGRPDRAALLTWAKEAGLTDVEIEVTRFTLIFRSAREFFYAPSVETGPLVGWKAVAGHGEHLQDAFFFTKEALERYFATERPRGTLPMTVVVSCLRARKPQ
jgi:SAM-dependent methyltransferase